MSKVPTVFRNLVSRVVRSFYDTKYILAMDILNRVDWLRDEELGRKLLIPTKEIQKICGKMSEDGFLFVINRNEVKGPGSRAIPRIYYAVDYARCFNVVKWKLLQINKVLMSNMDQANKQRDYQCPQCKRKWSPLDAVNMMHPLTKLFTCEHCFKTLELEPEKESKRSSQEMVNRLDKQSKLIRELLKECEMVKFNSTREQITQAMVKKEQAQKRAANGELAFAQDTGGNVTHIVVQLVQNDTTTKQELEAELEKKRQQNAMPIWFTQSTIRPKNNLGEISSISGDGSVQAVKNIDHQLNLEKKRIEKDLKLEKERFDFYETYYQELNQLTADSLNIEIKDDEVDDQSDTDERVLKRRKV